MPNYDSKLKRFDLICWMELGIFVMTAGIGLFHDLPSALLLWGGLQFPVIVVCAVVLFTE